MGYIRAKFGILNSSQSLDDRKNSYGFFSNLRISGQSFINENLHHSRTSHDIDMKLGPVAKIDKRNTAALKNFDDDVCRQIVMPLFFLIYC